MWWSSAMEMTDANAQGMPYRQVLAAATAQAAALLRQGTPFDFIFLHPDEAITGYRQVIRVRETGEVAVEPSP
jgi:hypothetical protein